MKTSFDTRFSLIKTFVKRDIVSRYQGSVFGSLWLLAQPLMQLALYSFVFGIIFRMKWNLETDGGNVHFGFILFSGILLHSFLSESLLRGPCLVTSYPSYVKKVIFPLNILALVNSFSALATYLFGLVVLITVFIISGGEISVNYIFLIFPIVMIFLFTLGFSWLLSAIGVYFKDINNFMTHLVTILLFTAPICYPMSMLPEKYQSLLYLNPITLPLLIFQDIVFKDQFEFSWSILVHLSVGSLLCCIGYIVFNKLKRGFSDAI
ncbi:ABC transporter permease [Vibrio fluvialis]|nr:ABC transporter permease [Vibrio fluvialis]